MAHKRKLSVTEVAPIFEGKDRLRNTRYYHTMATNPDTPPENMEMVDQYRLAHPDQFLTNEEIESDPGLLERRKGRNGDRRSYRTMDNGETYDPEGNMVEGWNDGGYTRTYQDPYRPSNYQMTAQELDTRRKGWSYRKKNPRDPSLEISDEEVERIMKGLKDPYRRSRYVDTVTANKQSNPSNVEKFLEYSVKHQAEFYNDDELEGIRRDREFRRNNPGYSGGYRNRNRTPRDYDRQSWDQNWQSKEQFNAMPQEKRSLFSKFIRSRDRNRNSKLALKILSDPNSTQENVQYTREVVREHPNIFWRPKK